ncbi:regulator of CO2-responsive genes isoform B [Micractinium conductrix]|uniref:Regulator of CO2-responsive genes isoform B n=1 Tax=Micractinium conductrix TaxID=554055 RepID=A0A2P6VNL8_9CHLO|nr:regulator of CO2-responsive genes isoform B [Micractinium conductrix]|eukprot:PSC75702.1 regulator of CO2-responsive genes isoform B [Micractinium conductrix]
MQALAVQAAAQRPSGAHCFSSRKRIAAPGRLALRPAASAATELAELQAKPTAVRKMLLGRGWDLNWVDGVTGEIMKRKLTGDVATIEAAVSYLESLGIPTKSVENMASINKQILGQPVAKLQAVVEYVQRQGASGKTLVTLLEAHPALLTYYVSADGKHLEKGASRASADVQELNGRRVAGASYWREGASFASAPKKNDAPTPEEAARIVVGPDPDRFYCPHPGCNRSFAELWRLKVHFRAPPDVRGSGKERGHGTELQFCPKCGKDLRPGKHHVGCSAGKSAPRQAAKRQRQQMSTTTESAGLTTNTTEQTTTGSWELAVRQPPAKQRRPGAEVESAQRTRRVGEAVGPLPGMEAAAAAAAAAAAGHPEPLLYTAGAAHLGGAQHLQQHDFDARQLQQCFASPAAGGGGGMPPPANAAQQQHHQQQQPAQLPHFDLPGGGENRAHSPSPLELFGTFGGGGGGMGGGSGSGGMHGGFGSGLGLDDHLSGEDDLLRIPSPPPLPADWEAPAARPGLLFDFDQFDANKRHQHHTGGASAPLVTVTTAMNPEEMLNPSDDYIWQILFAGENDAVPKRVTAHLHHPPATALSHWDEDPLLDSILADDLSHDLPPHGMQHMQQQHHHHQVQQQHQQQPYHHHQQQPYHQQQQPAGATPGGGSGSGGSGGTVPIAAGDGGATGGQHSSMPPAMEVVLSGQQVVPQQPADGPCHHCHRQQQHGGTALAAQQPYRNGYHAAAELGAPGVKVEGAAVAGGVFL